MAEENRRTGKESPRVCFPRWVRRVRVLCLPSSLPIVCWASTTSRKECRHPLSGHPMWGTTSCRVLRSDTPYSRTEPSSTSSLSLLESVFRLTTLSWRQAMRATRCCRCSTTDIPDRIPYNWRCTRPTSVRSHHFRRANRAGCHRNGQRPYAPTAGIAILPLRQSIWKARGQVPNSQRRWDCYGLRKYGED